MVAGNVKMAMAALKSTKWRSILTMFGVVVGIVAVVTAVSIGDGVKQQIVGQIHHIGSDLITIKPGRSVVRDAKGNITKINLSLAYGLGSGSLSDQDLQVIQSTPGVKEVSPVSVLSASAYTDERQYDNGVVLGTSADFADLLQQKIDYGTFFSKDEENRHVAVIGKRVAEQLFQENVPVGMTLTIRGQDYIVRGVFSEFSNTLLNGGVDYNKAIVIPYSESRQLMAGNTPIVEILARPTAPGAVSQTIASINQHLQQAHGGAADFAVLKQDENLAVTSDVITVLTDAIAGVAAISLLVGGIGIMNIMLVSVTERTREIGIRKAIGATNRQILRQFVTEATVLSVGGGVLGILLSILVNYALRIGTNLKPVVTWQVVVLATIVSVTIGIIFGVAPAFKAAHKDPIEALRYE